MDSAFSKFVASTLLWASLVWGGSSELLTWRLPFRDSLVRRRFVVKMVSSLHAFTCAYIGYKVLQECTTRHPLLVLSLSRKTERSEREVRVYSAIETGRHTLNRSRILDWAVPLVAGYYASDLVSDLYRIRTQQRGASTIDLTMLVHHAVPLASFPAYVRWRRIRLKSDDLEGNLPLADALTGCLMLSSISTIFLNLRWQWLALQRVLPPDGIQRGRNSRKSRVASLLTAWGVSGRQTLRTLNLMSLVSFFLGRVVIWPLMVLVYAQHTGKPSLREAFLSLPRHCSWGTAVLGALNGAWFIRGLRISNRSWNMKRRN